MSDHGAATTPLLDLLDDIHDDARLCYEHSPTHHQMIPVGRLAHEAAARVRELEDELRIGRQASEIVGRMATQQMERAERAEAERDALRAENDALRALLTKLRRDNAQADRLWQWHHAIDAALAQGENPKPIPFATFPTMLVCPYCWSKRCPRATDERAACTNSSETGHAPC